jgi:hypothetical protein
MRGITMHDIFKDDTHVQSGVKPADPSCSQNSQICSSGTGKHVVLLKRQATLWISPTRSKPALASESMEASGEHATDLLEYSQRPSYISFVPNILLRYCNTLSQSRVVNHSPRMQQRIASICLHKPYIRQHARSTTTLLRARLHGDVEDDPLSR